MVSNQFLQNASAIKILLAGRRLAATQGLGNLRVDQVAAASKVNKRMIYHYFGNKEGLEQMLVDWQIDELKRHCSQQANIATDRLFGSTRLVDWRPLSDHADIRSAARVVLQHLSQSEIALEGPIEEWPSFCIELLSFATLGVSEYSLIQKEKPSKPRIRMSAGRRQT